MYAICVAKLLRPDQITSERALRDVRGEAEVLDALNHPVILRGYGAVPDGEHPHYACGQGSPYVLEIA